MHPVEYLNRHKQKSVSRMWRASRRAQHRHRIRATDRAMLIRLFTSEIPYTSGNPAAFRLLERGLLRLADVTVHDWGAWKLYTLSVRGRNVAKQLVRQIKPALTW